MDNSHLFDADEQQDRLDKMPLSEQVKNGYWPECLSIKEICDFIFPVPHYTTKPDDKSKVREWRSDCNTKKKDNTRFKDRLIKACEDNLLEYKEVAKKEFYIPLPGESFRYDDRDILGLPRPTINKYYPADYTIQKDEFKRYLKSIRVWPINGLLVDWLADDGIEIGIKEKRITRILETIVEFDIDPMDIPEWNKQKIKAECLKDTGLFNGSGFDRAWQEATNPKKEGNTQVIKMRDKEKYL